MTTIWLPDDLVDILDELKQARHDPHRSDTVRALILHALADLSLLSSETIRALGLKKSEERRV